MGELQERIASTKNGSVTSVQAVYVPADDLTDPAPATTFAHLDATTVLSRKIVEQGIYPAVDPLESSSRILEADVVGEEHYEEWLGQEFLNLSCTHNSCFIFIRKFFHTKDCDDILQFFIFLKNCNYLVSYFVMLLSYNVCFQKWVNFRSVLHLQRTVL